MHGKAVGILLILTGLVGMACQNPAATAAPSAAPAASPDTSDYNSPTIGTLKYVPVGTFQRNATATNTSTVSAFRLGQYEITRSQWQTVMGASNDPTLLSASSGSLTDPVQMVSWYAAITFCNKLSLGEGLTPVYSGRR